MGAMKSSQWIRIRMALHIRSIPCDYLFGNRQSALLLSIDDGMRDSLSQSMCGNEKMQAVMDGTGWRSAEKAARCDLAVTLAPCGIA
jgi:hypothetical protein